MTTTRPSEFELIARYFAPMAGEGAFDLLDDAAIIAPPPGHDLVVTKDMLVADVHFFATDPPAAIARKALRVNLSDLAAKGARPLGFLLGLALPSGWTEDWLAQFAQGLAEDSRSFACPLLGGDTVRASAGLTLSITAFGSVPHGTMPPRRGVKPGDALYVTGTLGDAALGLQLRLHPQSDWAKALPEAARAHLLRRYLLPEPRNALAEAVRRHASAAMDISDGFMGDLAKMLDGGDCHAAIPLENLPLSPSAKTAFALRPALLETALSGGDDYELLIAVPPAREAGLIAALGPEVRVTRLGVAATGRGPLAIIDEEGTPLHVSAQSYLHF